VSNDVRDNVSERESGHNVGHARHDRLLVSRFAVGDTTGPDTDAARSLVDQCTDCSRLAADMTLLRTSIATLPAPKRTRNFRITEAQAEQLRGSALDRFLRRLAMPQLALIRPIAGVALAVGLVATVVGAGLPRAFLPTGASAPAATELNAGGNPTSQQFGTASDRVGVPTDAGSGSGETATQPSTVAAESTSLGPMLASTTPKAGETAPSDVATNNFTSAPAPAATSTHTAVIPLATSQPTNFAPARPTDESSNVDTADTTRLLLIYGGVTLAMIAFGVLLLSLYANRRTEDPLLR
jgi:hypothetical protein